MKTLKTLLAILGAIALAVIIISIVAGISRTGMTGQKVAVVNVEGIITDPFDVNMQLREYAEREDVSAVVVRIDSPGGAVGPSQEIYSEVLRLRKKKPVVASMGAIAASGGYYIAAAADKIVANPGTLTGSIGVIVEFINAEELLTKIGLKGYVVKSGKYKDVGSPFRSIDKDEEKLIQAVIDDVHGQFVEAVAKGRKKKTEEVALIADGRVLSGSQAKALGLVDEFGGLQDAIELGARLAGVDGEPKVIYPPKKFDLFKAVMGEGAGSVADILSGLRLMYLTPVPGK